MSFFENMNRKEKRKFNKLSPDEQAPIIEAELIQKVSPIMADQIAKAMIQGVNLVWEELYTEFVMPIDEEGADVSSKVIELLSAIRTQHLRLETNKAKENQDEV